MPIDLINKSKMLKWKKVPQWSRCEGTIRMEYRPHYKPSNSHITPLRHSHGRWWADRYSLAQVLELSAQVWGQDRGKTIKSQSQETNTGCDTSFVSPQLEDIDDGKDPFHVLLPHQGIHAESYSQTSFDKHRGSTGSSEISGGLCSPSRRGNGQFRLSCVWWKSTLWAVLAVRLDLPGQSLLASPMLGAGEVGQSSFEHNLLLWPKEKRQLCKNLFPARFQPRHMWAYGSHYITLWSSPWQSMYAAIWYGGSGDRKRSGGVSTRNYSYLLSFSLRRLSSVSN